MRKNAHLYGNAISWLQRFAALLCIAFDLAAAAAAGEMRRGGKNDQWPKSRISWMSFLSSWEGSEIRFLPLYSLPTTPRLDKNPISGTLLPSPPHKLGIVSLGAMTMTHGWLDNSSGLVSIDFPLQWYRAGSRKEWCGTFLPWLIHQFQLPSWARRWTIKKWSHFIGISMHQAILPCQIPISMVCGMCTSLDTHAFKV